MVLPVPVLPVLPVLPVSVPVPAPPAAVLQHVAASLLIVHGLPEQSVVAPALIIPLLPLLVQKLTMSVMLLHLALGGETGVLPPPGSGVLPPPAAAETMLAAMYELPVRLVAHKT
jgi:hypothetical protein